MTDAQAKPISAGDRVYVIRDTLTFPARLEIVSGIYWPSNPRSLLQHLKLPDGSSLRLSPCNTFLDLAVAREEMTRRQAEMDAYVMARKGRDR